MNKKIILGLPAIFGLGHLIKENLQYLGFEVIDISFDYRHFKYKNIFDRLTNLFYKTILKDKSYKDKLRFAAYQQTIKENLDAVTGRVDYAFIIRPDTYAEEILQLIKGKTDKLIGYQWDGIQRFPWIENFIPLFDRFFVFDPEDTQFANLQLPYLGNFYFTLPRLTQNPAPSQNLAYFVGTYSKERIEILSQLHSLLSKTRLQISMHMYSRKKRTLPADQQFIDLTTRTLSYEQNIETVKNAFLLIDITVDCHKGLSLRFFEALCFDKKLITNNPDVQYYEFYHPDNIFIYGKDELSQFESFIRKPYHTIDHNIKQKYSFDNWIRYALDIHPHIPIALPLMTND